MYRNGNYTAFYVAEPFSETSLGCHATKDFVYYNLLRKWKGEDPLFPFVDSHNKTYNVRDDSSWESTLKPRLRQRLNASKNIILFLSSRTISSRALKEEIDYGINCLGLPLIIIYPEYENKRDILSPNGHKLAPHIKKLWNNIPKLNDSIHKVPSLHLPIKKHLIRTALNESDFMINSKIGPDCFFYRIE